MKRRMWIILTLAVLAAALCCATALADTKGSCGDNATWTFDPGTGVLTISGTGDMWDYKGTFPGWNGWCDNIIRVEIASGVTSIGVNTFSFSSNLIEVKIPEGVTRIGDEAFLYCSSLEQITIPEGVTVIGEAAFDFCTNLKQVTIPEGVTTIGNQAFQNCTSLTEIIIPDSVTSIGVGAFFYCIGLTSVEVPASVNSMGYLAFARCDNLTSITIYNSEAVIGNGEHDVFSGCDDALVIYGWNPSTAKTYAKEWGWNFESIGDLNGQ